LPIPINGLRRLNCSRITGLLNISITGLGLLPTPIKSSILLSNDRIASATCASFPADIVLPLTHKYSHRTDRKERY
jgi:hypothetical protein